MISLREKWEAGMMPRLGFGAMRMPEKQNGIDIERVKDMVDMYLAAGMNYFDTAYGYQGGQSETTLREALTARYPRGAFMLADKMPFWQVEKSGDMERIFAHQLEKCGVDYFDFYLLHAMDDEMYGVSTRFGGYEFIKARKAAGQVKHIGFSFHGDAALLNRILDECPEMEFVQLQINYLDWKDYGAQELYDIAVAHGLPVIVMEPVRGGALAVLPKRAEDVFSKAEPAASAASWAMRYVASLPGVMTILSGMSTAEQVKDNVTTLKDFVPLASEEYAVIDRVLDALRQIKTVPCTACRYCAGCPREIPIADVFSMYNRYAGDMELSGFRRAYEEIPAARRVAACVDCGACEAACPQGIQVPRRLKESVSVL